MVQPADGEDGYCYGTPGTLLGRLLVLVLLLVPSKIGAQVMPAGLMVGNGDG